MRRGLRFPYWVGPVLSWGKRFAGWSAAVVAVGAAVGVPVAAAEFPVTADVRIAAAFAAIDAGDRAPDQAAKVAAYRTAVVQGEEAVRLDESNPEAHYALFCASGRLTELSNPIDQALALPRLRRELDRTLALDPHHIHALAAKAEMRLRLPRVLGGDPREAEALARQALEYDTTFWRAHVLLARVLVSEDRPSAAREVLANLLEVIPPERPERAEGLDLLQRLPDGH